MNPPVAKTHTPITTRSPTPALSPPSTVGHAATCPKIAASQRRQLTDCLRPSARSGRGVDFAGKGRDLVGYAAGVLERHQMRGPWKLDDARVGKQPM